MADTPEPLFELLNEVAIISQLSGSLFEARLPDGFLVSHFGVLNHLLRVNDAPTPRTLARSFQVPKTTMTHTLSGLARHGLIRFEPNPRDGRSKCVRITEAGRRFHGDAIAAIGPDLAALAARIDTAHLAGTLPALRELRAALDAMRDV